MLIERFAKGLTETLLVTLIVTPVPFLNPSFVAWPGRLPQARWGRERAKVAHQPLSVHQATAGQIGSSSKLLANRKAAADIGASGSFLLRPYLPLHQP